MKTIFLLLLLFIMSACVPTNEISHDFQLVRGQSTGVVILSLTHREGIHDSYPPRCAYRGLNNNVMGGTQRGDSGFIPLDKTIIFSKTATNLIGRAAVLGRVVAMELPGGAYEFFRCDSTGALMRTYSVEEFSIKFSVNPGAVTYLGNIQFIVAPSGSTFNIFIEDRRDRDFEIVRRTWPKFRGRA
jgi:hypothetical protein